MNSFYLLFVSLIISFVRAEYSIVFYSRSIPGLELTYNVYVNELLVLTETTDALLDDWADFPATLGDEINVQVSFNPADPANNFNIGYYINNAAGGTGEIVYNSAWTTFRPKNFCTTGTCTFTITNPGITWDGSSATFYNQNNQVLFEYAGQASATFQAQATDSLRMVFVRRAPPTAYTLTLSVDSENIFWYYNAYGSNAMVANDQSPSVSLLLPNNGTLFNSGTTIYMQLTSTPTAGNYFTSLICPNNLRANFNVQSNTAGPQTFNLPSSIFGSPCILSTYYPYTSENFASVTVTKPVSFSLPAASSSHYINTGIPVKLTSEAQESYGSAMLVSVNQNCGGTPHVYENVQVGVEFVAMPPLNYMGSCTFSSTANGVFRASTVNPSVTITKGLVTISTPSNGAIITAGASPPIYLSTSSVDASFTVNLDCGAGMSITHENIPGNTPQGFFIPPYYSGDACVFTVTAPLNLFNVANQVTVTITGFVSPTGGATYPISSEQSASFASSINFRFVQTYQKHQKYQSDTQ